MISKDSLKTFTKKISKNTNLISFCNKIISYNDILNNDEARNIFFSSLISSDILIDIHSCNETIETAEFIINNINLMILEDDIKQNVIEYLKNAISIANRDKELLEYDYLKDYR